MEIRYQRTFEDCQEAVAAQRMKPLRAKIIAVLVFVPIFILAVVLLMSVGMSQGLAVLTIVVGLPLLASLVSYAYRTWLKHDFRRHRTIALPEVIRIDDIGLHAESEFGNGTTKWLAYTRFQETRNLALLYLGPRMVHMLPKRAFSSEQWEEFCRLVAANVSQDSANRKEEIKHAATS